MKNRKRILLIVCLCVCCAAAVIAVRNYGRVSLAERNGWKTAAVPATVRGQAAGRSGPGMQYDTEDDFAREGESVTALFEKYIRKLRITPVWDVRLEFVEDPAWPKTGDFRIDCDDRKAILLLNAASPRQENIEEVIVHELMHIKMYPLD